MSATAIFIFQAPETSLRGRVTHNSSAYIHHCVYVQQLQTLYLGEAKGGSLAGRHACVISTLLLLNFYVYLVP